MTPRRRLTPEEWRQVEGRYQALWRSWRELLDSLNGVVRAPVLDRILDLEGKVVRVGAAIESEAVRQLGSEDAPWFPNAPRRPELVRRPHATVSQMSRGVVAIERRP